MGDIERQARIVLEAASIEVRIGHFRADCDVPALARAVIERGDALRRLEWSAAVRDNVGIWPACPVCWAMKHDGHAPDCELAKALAVGGE